MATMSFTWTLSGAGWAECRVEDSEGQATADVSYICASPDEFISAVTRLVLGATGQRVQFMAEPEAYRWIFDQERGQVGVRLLTVPDWTVADEAGTVIWATRQPVGTLARVIIRAFDQVRAEYGDDDYLQRWRRPFPHHELEALRTAWRTTQPGDRRTCV